MEKENETEEISTLNESDDQQTTPELENMPSTPSTFSMPSTPTTPSTLRTPSSTSTRDSDDENNSEESTSQPSPLPAATWQTSNGVTDVEENPIEPVEPGTEARSPVMLNTADIQSGVSRGSKVARLEEDKGFITGVSRGPKVARLEEEKGFITGEPIAPYITQITDGDRENSGAHSSRDVPEPLPEESGGVPSGAVSATTAGRAKECAGCGKRITERYLLKALDLFWHEDCLKCGCCDSRLGELGSTLYTKANLILCRRDYLRLFGTTGYCAACSKIIPAFEMVMRAKSNVYHLECFACQQCNHRFCVGDRFYLCDNKILCEYDYEERLVFANIAYNPSSLAHIRRQVGSLQPARDNLGVGTEVGHRLTSWDKGNVTTRDDGSSGYGSPDSETLDAQ